MTMELETHQPSLIEKFANRRILAVTRKMTGGHGGKKSWRISPSGAKVLSFCAGFFLTAAIVAIEIAIFGTQIPFEKIPTVDGLLFAFIALALTLLELYLLAEIAIRATATVIANMMSEKEAREDPLFSSLARAALEIREPRHQPFGLNPSQFVKKRRQLLLAAIWKGKAFATSFLAKQIVKRLLPRSVFRTYSALVAAPVIGFWNVWGMHIVLAEVHHRIGGRRICEYVMVSLDEHLPDGSAAWGIMTRIVALRIIHFGAYNVNLDYLISELHSRSQAGKFTFPESFETDDDIADFFNCIPENEAAVLKKCALLTFAIKRQAFTSEEQAIFRNLGIPVEELERVKKGIRSFDNDPENGFGDGSLPFLLNPVS